MSIFKAHICAMSAYSPPLEGRDPKQHLLLDFNERTLPLGEHVREALVAYINGGRMQMYPSYGDSVERIARYVGVPAEQLMITNGSDQGIDLIFRAACREGDEAIIPGPSFAMYRQCALIENLTLIEPQYTKDGGFPTREVLAAIGERTKIICIANPNNPSGTAVSREDILAIARAAPQAAVLVDECYFEYVRETVVDCVSQYPNILVTRTFSKTWGMPSLRLGYVVATRENILALLNIRGPYDINQLAVVAVKAALEEPSYTHNYVREVMEQSKPLFERFLAQEGIDYWPSAANYIWMFPDNAEQLGEKLRQHNILIRPKTDASGKLGLRVTLGTLAQTQRLIAAIRG